MRRALLFLAFFAALLLAPRPGRAAAPEVQIHLLTMGPGDHLYTRGGHAALMVAEVEDGAVVRSTVYNYGDTDWDDPLLVPHFLRGDLTFFLSDTGELLPTLEEYGVRQGRAVYRQRLHLLPEQAAEVARRLREGVAPGKREYTFHHVHALCSTRIMDLLDDVLGGKLRSELEPAAGPHTARHYHEVIFSGSLLASIGGDLFLGRLHDRVLDKYESTASPEHMRDYLQTILVPAAAGSTATVPLAEPPIPVVLRDEPLVLEKHRLAHPIWGALIASLLVAFASAYRRVPGARERAQKTVFWAALCSGVLGLLMLAFLVFSRVPEFRQNELLLLFWPADLWLAVRMRRALTEESAPGSWVQSYAHARLGVAALVVIGHLTGVLVQEPRILVALGCVEAAVFWALIRALRFGHAEAPSSTLRTTDSRSPATNGLAMK